MKLCPGMKYFPMHLKIFQLLTLIPQHTNQHVLVVSLLMGVLDPSSNYFINKPKPLKDKMIPSFDTSIKISKDHLDTSEIKDRILRCTLDALTVHIATYANHLSFCEMVLPLEWHLRKTKKHFEKNNGYRKAVGHLLDLIAETSTRISAIRDKTSRF